MPALIFAAVLFWLGLCCGSVFAQEHRHPKEHDRLHTDFYRHWMMPDNRGVSCCHDEDCKPAFTRRRPDGKWQARHDDGDEWADVPNSKIETERDSPDGQSHLCGRKSMLGFTVFCFIAGSGG